MSLVSSVRGQMMRLFRRNKKDKGLVNASVSTSINADISESGETLPFERRSTRRGSKLLRSFRKRFSRSKGQLSSGVVKRNSRVDTDTEERSKGTTALMSTSKDDSFSRRKMREEILATIPKRGSVIDSRETTPIPILSVNPSIESVSNSNVFGNGEPTSKPQLVVVSEVTAESRRNSHEPNPISKKKELAISETKTPRRSSANESNINKKVLEPSKPTYGAPPSVRVGRSSSIAATTKRGKVSLVYLSKNYNMNL